MYSLLGSLVNLLLGSLLLLGSCVVVLLCCFYVVVGQLVARWEKSQFVFYGIDLCPN